MALELVKLDSGTLPSIADAIREKTGVTALLLPSQMAGAIGAIKTLRVETGTIIPAQDSATLTVPYAGEPKALLVEASEEALAGKAATIAAYGMIKHLLFGQPSSLRPDLPMIAYVQTATGMKARNLVQMEPAGVISTPNEMFPWVSGAEYRWTAYYWEDET